MLAALLSRTPALKGYPALFNHRNSLGCPFSTTQQYSYRDRFSPYRARIEHACHTRAHFIPSNSRIRILCTTRHFPTFAGFCYIFATLWHQPHSTLIPDTGYHPHTDTHKYLPTSSIAIYLHASIFFSTRCLSVDKCCCCRIIGTFFFDV